MARDAATRTTRTTHATATTPAATPAAAPVPASAPGRAQESIPAPDSRPNSRPDSRPGSQSAPPQSAPRSAPFSLFDWEARDAAGERRTGTLHARDPAHASATLRAQGLVPIGLRGRRLRPGERVAPKDVAQFSRQLATLLKAGVPLLQALDIVARGHGKPGFTGLIQQLRADIEAGSGLAQALRQHPRHFDALYCNLVDAGEQGGMLEAMLERLSQHMDKSLALKRRVGSAMIYPLAVLTIAFAVMALLMLFVVPAFKSVFAGFGVPLPVPTLLAIRVSDALVDNWYAVIGMPLGLPLLWVRARRGSGPLQRATDRLLLQIPVFGRLARQAAMARWTRTMAMLFRAGLPLAESMDAVGRATGSRVYCDAAARIGRDVVAGSSLTDAMRATGLFDNMVLQMTQIGEESGALDTMLIRAAEFHEGEIDDTVAAIASLVEPVVIAVLGLLIGGMVVAMYLPVFRLGQVF